MELSESCGNRRGIRLVWLPGRPKLSRVELGSSNNDRLPPPGSRAAELLDLLERFVQGEPVELPLTALELTSVSNVQLKILETLRRAVPRGKVIAYAALAEKAEIPRGARAVGSAMRHNPFPLFFPCHRVIASDGSLAGFMGEKGAGSAALTLKKQLLLNEGVTFLPNAKVAPACIIA